MFLPFVDRFSPTLTGAFLVLLILMAVLDYKYARRSYESWQHVEQATANLQFLMGKLFSLGDASTIETPINFRYLDQARVETHYNQIEPELIEKERTVISGQSIDGKGSLATGPATAEVGIGKKHEATSSFERSSFSSARKCAELMKFVLEQNRARYYTDGGNWYIKASSKELKEAYDKALRDARNSEIDLQKLPYESPVGSQTPEEKEATERKIKQLEGELKAELSSLSGLVFVDATFDIQRPSKKAITLTEVFAEKPARVIFKVVGLRAVDFVELSGKSKSHLRVFGGVTEPLGEEGLVEIEAIAVY